MFTSTGTQTDTIPAANGCDSIVTITVTVDPILTTSTFDTVCQGDSVQFAGQMVGAAGIYYDTLSSSSTGCDSVIDLTLTVLSISNFNDTISICAGDSVLLGGAYQNTSGNYVDTLTGANGCDSVLNTNLVVLPDTTITVPQTICDGDSFFAASAYQFTSGQYVDVFTGSSGCDSTIITDLTVLPNTSSTQPVSICDGDSYFAGGANQTNAGFYYDTLLAANGCDSVVITDLSVLPVDSTPSARTMCQGDSLFLANAWQTAAGVYRDTLSQVNNTCDSIVITTLTVTPPVTESVNASICEKDSIFLQNAWQNQSGTYYDTTTSLTTGCDSVVITTLVVNLDPNATVVGDNTFCVGESTQIFATGGGSYTWSPTAGLSDPFIADPITSPLIITNYVVTITDNNGCYDTASITVYPLPFGIQIPDTFECVVDDVQLQAPEIEGATYSWLPAEGLSSTTIPNPIASPTQNTVYTVTVVDSQGCVGTASTLVIVCPIEVKPVYIPNIFSPNGDGENDVFYVYGTTVKFLRMQIFNRWGEKVFESTDQRVGWDGIYKGKMQNPAVFVYKIDITLDDDTKLLKAGSVTLVR